MYFYVPAADVSVLPREMSRSDRGVRNREALSVSPNNSRRRKKRDRGTLLDLLVVCERPKRRQTFPFSLGRCHAVTEGYETARPGAFVQTLFAVIKKRDRRNTLQSLDKVRAKGLEPIRTKAPDPKSGLATNYNTLANPFRKTHNIKPIAEYDLVGSCRILCPKRNTKIVKDFQFSKPVRIFVKNTEKKYDICASKKNK